MNMDIEEVFLKNMNIFHKDHFETNLFLLGLEAQNPTQRSCWGHWDPCGGKRGERLGTLSLNIHNHHLNIWGLAVEPPAVSATCGSQSLGWPLLTGRRHIIGFHLLPGNDVKAGHFGPEGKGKVLYSKCQIFYWIWRTSPRAGISNQVPSPCSVIPHIQMAGISLERNTSPALTYMRRTLCLFLFMETQTWMQPEMPVVWVISLMQNQIPDKNNDTLSRSHCTQVNGQHTKLILLLFARLSFRPWWNIHLCSAAALEEDLLHCDIHVAIWSQLD